MQNSLKINYLYNILLKSLNLFFPLIILPYVSRVLNPDGVGKVEFSLSIIQYFVILAQIGIPTYGLRQSAKYKNNKNELSKFIQEILIINIISIGISYLIFLLFLKFYDYEYHRILIILSFNIVSLNLTMDWFYQGIEEYKHITKRTFIIKIITLVFILVFIKKETDYYIYAMILAVSNILTSIYNLINMKKYIFIFKKYNGYEISKHIKTILVLSGITLSIAIYTNIDKTMLGWIKGDAAVGIYTSSLKIINMLVMIVTSFSAILLPRIVFYIENKDYYNIELLVGKANRFIMMLAIPIIFGIIMISSDIVVLLLGNEFKESINILIILTPLILILGIANLTGTILLAYEREKITLLSTTLGAIINFIINLILIPKIGIYGATISTIIAEIVVTVIQIKYVKKYIKISINFKNTKCYILNSLLILPICYIVKMVIDNNFISMIGSILLSAIVYISRLYFIRDEFIYSYSNKYIINIKTKYKLLKNI